MKEVIERLPNKKRDISPFFFVMYFSDYLTMLTATVVDFNLFLS